MDKVLPKRMVVSYILTVYTNLRPRMVRTTIGTGGRAKKPDLLLSTNQRYPLPL
jgi:hypothetical protein